MTNIVLVLENIRSAQNVGSIFRSADGLGVKKLYLSGFTPYPAHVKDSRLPHEQSRIQKQITKTALGAETSVPWQYFLNTADALDELKQAGYQLVALEQTKHAQNLREFVPGPDIALIVGNEISGLSAPTLAKCDQVVEIKMKGQKESFNVAVAAALALYQLSS